MGLRAVLSSESAKCHKVNPLKGGFHRSMGVVVPFKRRGVEELVDQQTSRRQAKLTGGRHEGRSNKPAFLQPSVVTVTQFTANRTAAPSFPRKPESCA